jgi:copper chaperone CopZ
MKPVMKNTILLFFFAFISMHVNAQTTSVKIQTSAQCGECKAAIEKQLNYEKGVKSAKLDDESKIVTVIYNSEKTNPDILRKSIASIGYDADSIPANPKAYKKLKSCCLKKEPVKN